MENLKTKLSYVFCTLLIVGSLTSCDDNQGMLGWHNEVNSDGLKNSYRTIKIEECEYIMYDAGRGYSANGFLAHKGNCKSKIHTCN